MSLLSFSHRYIFDQNGEYFNLQRKISNIHQLAKPSFYLLGKEKID